MKTISKILSIALCLAMVLGLFTFGVAAENTTATLTAESLETYSSGDDLGVETVDGVVFTPSQGTHTNTAPRLYINSSVYNIRLYKNNTLTITVPTGNKIVSIVATATGTSYALKATVTGAAVSVSGAVTTITASAATDTLVITPTATCRLASIAVTYAPTDAAPCEHNMVPGYDKNNHWVQCSKCLEYEVTVTPHTLDASGACSGCDYVETINTIAEALAGTDGTEFIVKGEVTFIDGKNVQIQDATGGINIYLTDYATCSVGDVIKATGSKGAFNGLPQLGGATYTVEEEGVNAITPLVGGEELIVDENLCKKLSLSGSFLVTDVDSNGTITMVLSSGDKIKIYKAPTVEGLKAGDVITSVDCVLSTHNNLQLRCNAASDIQYTSFVLSEDMSMTLDNTLYVHFQIGGVSDFTAYTAKLTVGEADPIDCTIDNNGVITAPLMVSQLDEAFTLNVYCSGETLVDTKTDMANDYLNRMIENANSTQRLKNICSALLAYGEYTEKGLVDDATGSITLSGELNAALASTDNNTSEDKNLKRLNLTNAVDIEIKLNAKWLQTGYTYSINGGDKVDLTQESDLLVTITGIPVANWGEKQTVVVYNAEGEAVNTIEYAVMSYAYDRLVGQYAAEPEAAVGLNNLLTAMANYYLAVTNAIAE